MSLLEQHRARAAASTDDDETLEQAFAEVTSISEPTETKKRTREDIIRNLRAKRQNGDMSTDQLAVEKSKEDGSTLEVAKKTGKFKPIGFKPIGQTEEKEKKRKIKERKENVKKKRKVESGPVQSGTNTTSDKLAEGTPAVPQERSTTEPSSSKTSKKEPEPEPTLLDEDFDIFAGAGDYEGFPSDGESEEEHHDTEETRAASTSQDVFPVPAVGTKGWFDEPEPEVQHAPTPPEKPPVVPETKVTEEEEPQEMRLKPLESSALPSIRDFLAMEEAAQKAEKRKARKEKKKKKKAGGDDDDD